MRLNKVLLLSIALLSPMAQAFGPTGHRIIAEIAEMNIKPNTKQQLMQITRGKSLARIANWPDEIRSDSNWDHAKPWHYISIADDESFETLKRSKQGDIWSALNDFEAKLKDPMINGRKRWEALAFYVHLMGDVHQPLHVGRRDDSGGNKVAVIWFNRPSTLHSVWDSKLIEHERLSYSEYAIILNNQKKKAEKHSYLDYLRESKRLRNQIYDFDKSAKLDYPYVYKNTNTVEQQLLKAGLRLAAHLDAIFSKRTALPKQ